MGEVVAFRKRSRRRSVELRLDLSTPEDQQYRLYLRTGDKRVTTKLDERKAMHLLRVLQTEFGVLMK